MESINVLVTAELPAEVLTALRSVDPSLRVQELAAHERVLFASGAHLAEVSHARWQRSLQRRLEETEILISFPQSPADLGAAVPKLRMLQLLTAGADELPDQEIIKRVPVTTIREVRARPVAEYAMLLILAFAKRLPESLALQRRREWLRLDLSEVRGRTLGIVGLGSIGREIARLADAFGMRVLATRRTLGGEKPQFVDELLGPEMLPELLRRSDFVVLSAPATEQTYHLIGKDALRAMQRHAVLINVARGALVDESSLVEALKTGVIAGAALDVFEQEPLPASSALYELGNVILTSHNAGITDRFARDIVPILVDNLRRFLAGEPLRNQIDPMRGY